VKGDSPAEQSSTDREKTAGEGITKKNPGDRAQDREDKVSSLCGVRNIIVAPQGESPNKSSIKSVTH
jgi:hypothetical protein